MSPDTPPTGTPVKSRAGRWRDSVVGLGLVMGAGVGTVIGLLWGGGEGIALGAAIGGGLGVVLGAIARNLIEGND